MSICRTAIFFWMAGWMFTSPAIAESEVPNAFGELSASFTREVRLSRKRFRQLPQTIIYGNDQTGYFDSSDFKVVNDLIVLKLIPPTYQFPIRFFVPVDPAKKKSPQWIEIGQKLFQNPLPKAIRNLAIRRSGQPLSTPFLLLNASLPRSQRLDSVEANLHPSIFQQQKFRYTFLVAVNRLGEIIWAHIPLLDGTVFSSYISSKPIGKGYYGIMFGKQAGFFEIVRYDGQVIRKFSSRDVPNPFTMHHDFEILSTRKLFAISNTRGKLSDFGGHTGNDRTFLSSTLIGIDLATGRSTVLHDFLKSFNPNTTPYITGDDSDDRKFVGWGEEKADFDFLHANAVEIIKDQGVMVSLRNINKIVMLDHRFQNIKWTLGTQPSDTYRIVPPQDQFEHAHSPTMIGDDKILLFDNGVERHRSRLAIYQLDEGQAKLSFKFEPNPSLFAPNRSSVYRLGNGNILALFVNPLRGNEKTFRKPNEDIILEINPSSSQVVSSLTIALNTLSPGYRAIPLNAIGLEEWRGQTLDALNLTATPARSKGNL